MQCASRAVLSRPVYPKVHPLVPACLFASVFSVSRIQDLRMFRVNGKRKTSTRKAQNRIDDLESELTKQHSSQNKACTKTNAFTMSTQKRCKVCCVFIRPATVIKCHVIRACTYIKLWTRRSIHSKKVMWMSSYPRQ